MGIVQSIMQIHNSEGIQMTNITNLGPGGFMYRMVFEYKKQNRHILSKL